METNANSPWVAERLAKVAPTWTPNLPRAHATLNRKLRPQPRAKAWLAAPALAALAIAILALPQGRAMAQELWFRLFLNRIDVVRVDLSDTPFHTNLMGSGLHAVNGLDEAGTRAGFPPRLPAAGSWLGKPTLSVIGAMSLEFTVRTTELRAALARTNASHVAVPDQWDGLTLRAGIGPLVAADYPGEVQILQSRPIQLSLPHGFPLSQFAETVFRSVGLSWWEARALARRYAANPSWLIGIPSDEPARIEEVSLRSGTGLLVEEFTDDGTTGRVTLVFSDPDRIYAVMSPSRELCLKAADALP